VLIGELFLRDGLREIAQRFPGSDHTFIVSSAVSAGAMASESSGTKRLLYF
jgi:hypothetical protein